MKIRQLSVFLENRPGRLSALCDILSKAGVNLSSLTLADTKEFGLLRLLSPDVDKASQALKEANYATTVTEVIALRVPDRPGGLASVLNLLEHSGVSIEYMYAFATHKGSEAVMIFRFDDHEKALSTLKSSGLSICKSVELFGA
jgi:hypothetical protein